MGPISPLSVVMALGSFAMDMLAQNSAQKERDDATQRMIAAEAQGEESARKAALTTAHKGYDPKTVEAGLQKTAARDQRDIDRYVTETQNPLGTTTPGQGGELSSAYTAEAARTNAADVAGKNKANAALARMLAPDAYGVEVQAPIKAQNMIDVLRGSANARGEYNAGALDYQAAQPNPIFDMLGQALGAAPMFVGGTTPTKTVRPKTTGSTGILYSRGL